MNKEKVWFELKVGKEVILTKYFYDGFVNNRVTYYKTKFIIDKISYDNDNVNVRFIEAKHHSRAVWLDSFNKTLLPAPYCLICKEPNKKSENIFKKALKKIYTYKLNNASEKNEMIEYYKNILKACD